MRGMVASEGRMNKPGFKPSAASQKAVPGGQRQNVPVFHSTMLHAILSFRSLKPRAWVAHLHKIYKGKKAMGILDQRAISIKKKLQLLIADIFWRSAVTDLPSGVLGFYVCRFNGSSAASTDHFSASHELGGEENHNPLHAQCICSQRCCTA